MTPEQLQIIQHSLGVDQYGQGRQYRNHFVTEQTGRDGAICESLCAYGLMERDNRFPNELSGGSDCYHVTEAGKRLFFANCPRPPRKTRSQKRYEEWLRLDGCSGETFGQWLKNRKKQRV
jgi:hypothetical protein